VIELLDPSVARSAGELDVPELHELVAAPLLLGRQAGRIFGHLDDGCMESACTRVSIRLLRRLDHPGVGAEEVERAEDPLLDREFRRQPSRRILRSREK